MSGGLVKAKSPYNYLFFYCASIRFLAVSPTALRVPDNGVREVKGTHSKSNYQGGIHDEINH